MSSDLTQQRELRTDDPFLSRIAFTLCGVMAPLGGVAFAVAALEIRGESLPRFVERLSYALSFMLVGVGVIRQLLSSWGRLDGARQAVAAALAFPVVGAIRGQRLSDVILVTVLLIGVLVHPSRGQVVAVNWKARRIGASLATLGVALLLLGAIGELPAEGGPAEARDRDYAVAVLLLAACGWAVAATMEASRLALVLAGVASMAAGATLLIPESSRLSPGFASLLIGWGLTSMIIGTRKANAAEAPAAQQPKP